MEDSSDKPEAPKPSYVLAERDYADVVHLENPSVIEQVLSKSRSEAVTYVSKLLQSGVPRYILAGPRVAFTAMAVEALNDLWTEVSAWRKERRIPENFSGRESGYQTWVELLQEIDSNPVDAGRLKAMKAMFLAANEVTAGDEASILAYQLFQIARGLNSSQLLLLRAVYRGYLEYTRMPRTGGSIATYQWREQMAHRLGHKLSALIVRDERKLVEYGLIMPWVRPDELEVPLIDARMTDLGIKFCQNLASYQETQSSNSA